MVKIVRCPSDYKFRRCGQIVEIVRRQYHLNAGQLGQYHLNAGQLGQYHLNAGQLGQ